MTKKSFEVGLNPAVLRWARESSGWSVEELSAKVNTTPEKFRQWERGESYPTLRQLEKLSKCLKRSLVVFFLPEPPKEPPMPKDFRLIPESEGKFSKDTLLAMRRARRLQRIAQELAKNLGIEPIAKVERASIEHNPVDIAGRERKKLGISIDTQLKWHSPYRAFNEWRIALESLNILTFQFKMPVKDVRGFSLRDEGLPVIVVSSTDLITARIFTLFHEYGHIILDEAGICNPQMELLSERTTNEVENWTNTFAGEMLLPQEIILTQPEFSAIPDSPKPLELLENLSRNFNVSKHFILVRLLTLGIISKERYKEILMPLSTPVERKGFGISPDKKCIYEHGSLYLSLVLKNVEKGIITYDNALDYLSTKLKYLDRIEKYAR